MQAKVQRYLKLIASMDIPDARKNFNQPNVRWFLRNDAIKNRAHKNIDAALSLARELA